MGRPFLVGLALLAACSGGTTRDPGSPPAAPPGDGGGSLVMPSETALALDSEGQEIPPNPNWPDGPLATADVDLLERIYASLTVGVDLEAVRDLGRTADPRLGWVLTDLLRFFPTGPVAETAVASFNDLMNTTQNLTPFGSVWKTVTDLMIAWDIPGPPDYVDYKQQMFTLVDPRWEPFFAGESGIDWRLVSWGGVLIDDRELGDPEPCSRGCIPALDDPAVTDAAGGSWYPDDGIVFAVSVNGESRAYPKNIMEVHEMVNDTVGGRRIGMPYCTLCGSAQAYLTDGVPEGVPTPVLRTSGLLSRSNKVMYDLVSWSVFDTFTGVALSGPLRDKGVTLEQVTVLVTTWGDWKEAHPNTTIVAEDGGIGRSYPDDPLRGRDDAGPIFPVGDVDPRLGVQVLVIGVSAPGGTVIAFPADDARAALEAGRPVEGAGVRLALDGRGLRAFTAAGEELAAHQSFWFAWSQFHPETLLWQP